MLLDTYTALERITFFRWVSPHKRINKCKLKFKYKPWIILGLHKPISVKKKLLTNFINKKDPILEEQLGH